MLFLVLPEYIMANHHSRIETNKHMIHFSAITTTPTQKTHACLHTHPHAHIFITANMANISPRQN